ncbi:MAG: ribose 5-phosphate isomerase B [Dictyoglomi bacterium]|jgi:ribose 5-phosphate isomerase B|nr:ribose 5-phosphate isomerase B [Dictyoglomota bacterium]HHV80679.1 ribose 5-phosphate isomerase B [bacterium]HOL55263.1 ribose 5-phosphate isomerase B [bacterium]HPO82633.1 ribose 5-phosphate isomerase B [bacterium]HRU33029.1 ribose 5-phosphate isomerase B [bacterium]
MKVAIGSDHAGFRMKEELKNYIKTLDIEVKDLGCYSEDPVDYPDIARDVAISTVKGETDRGILICGTGIGMSIAANKIKGIRAAVGNEILSVRFSREHNNANILTLGARIIGIEVAKEAVRVFLETSFLGGRHQRRIEKIGGMEELRCI